MHSLLIVDDQTHVLDALELLFDLHGVPTRRATTPDAALELVRAGDIGAVLQDMNFSQSTTTGEEGIALFQAIRAIDPDMPVVLMTAWGALETAVALVKQGADDYLQKPLDDAALVKKIQTLLAVRALPRAPSNDGRELCGLVFQSAVMSAVVKLAVKVAASDASVLVTGPNGTGKELLSHIVHANSARRDKPFIKVNVGALPDELFSAELFGAEAGAFTGARGRRIGRFEAADGGTLLLDEIGNLSMASQAKLLRALQSGEFERLGSNETRRVDVRVIAATNVDMKQAIADGSFREDLYYRLAVIELASPALKDRAEDIPLLAEAFIEQQAEAKGNDSPVTLTPACVAAMRAYPWGGNVRELHNRLQRALLVCESGTLSAEDLGLTPAPVDGGHELEAPNRFDAAERETLEAALRESDYVVSAAARSLGVSRQALYRRMRRLGVTVKRDVDG